MYMRKEQQTCAAFMEYVCTDKQKPLICGESQTSGGVTEDEWDFSFASAFVDVRIIRPEMFKYDQVKLPAGDFQVCFVLYRPRDS